MNQCIGLTEICRKNGKTIIYWEHLWFPADFPLNQSILALLIILTILIFIFILLLRILTILIIPIVFIILIILFVLIIVVINSFLLPSLWLSSVSFIVLVSNLINIKRLALFVTCSNSKKPRKTVAAFRLHLANPPSWLPPYPSPASFRTSPWPQVNFYAETRLHTHTRFCA